MAVHGVAAAEANEHGFGSAGHAQNFMAENQVIGLCEGWKGPLTLFNDLAHQGFPDFVGGATNFRTFGHTEMTWLGFEDLFEGQEWLIQRFSQS